jgi:hypothetical protein
MPGTYPPTSPTLTGNLVTIDRMLQSPTYIRRRLRDFRDLRFVSDQVLTGRLRSSGGAVLFEQSEPFVTDRAVRSVPAGAEYPIANMPAGVAGLAAVAKWGQKTELTFEQAKRSQYPGQEVARALRKVVNTVISQVDSVALAAVASAVTQTFSVTAAGGIAWNLANATILRDILRAKATIANLKLGYSPDTLLMTESAAAYVMSDPVISSQLQREVSTNPVYTGEIVRLGGLAIVTSPSAPTDPWLFDSTALGGMADEQEVDPGYSVDEQAIQVKAWIDNQIDGWWIQGRRITVPVVQETGAGIRITNTAVG